MWEAVGLAKAAGLPDSDYEHIRDAAEKEDQRQAAEDEKRRAEEELQRHKEEEHTAYCRQRALLSATMRDRKKNGGGSHTLPMDIVDVFVDTFSDLLSVSSPNVLTAW